MDAAEQAICAPEIQQFPVSGIMRSAHRLPIPPGQQN
jgi:hypothetical protein